MEATPEEIHQAKMLHSGRGRGQGAWDAAARGGKWKLGVPVTLDTCSSPSVTWLPRTASPTQQCWVKSWEVQPALMFSERLSQTQPGLDPEESALGSSVAS